MLNRTHVTPRPSLPIPPPRPPLEKPPAVADGDALVRSPLWDDGGLNEEALEALAGSSVSGPTMREAEAGEGGGSEPSLLDADPRDVITIVAHQSGPLLTPLSRSGAAGAAHSASAGPSTSLLAGFFGPGGKRFSSLEIVETIHRLCCA